MNLNRALKGYGAYKAYDYIKKSKWANDASDWALDRAGLERKSTVSRLFGSFGLFAFGMIVGGTVGMILAPMRGAEIRSTMREKGLKGAAEKVRSELAHNA